MSEGSARRIDPRFDPRFQRGYVPGETGGSRASDASPDPAALTPATLSAETGAADAPPAPSRAGARTSVASGEATTQGAGAGAVGERAAPAEGAGAGAVAERAAPADPRAGSDAEVVSWFDEPEPDPPSADPWFLGAWTVSVVAFALGATLVLAGIMSEGYYGAPNESERWLQIIGWTVAPALMQGGVLGIVVMIVWAGLRHARRAEADAEAPS